VPSLSAYTEVEGLLLPSDSKLDNFNSNQSSSIHISIRTINNIIILRSVFYI
jgi:hypothetical protein